MSKYKLYYFDTRGRAEIIRLILTQAGQPFDDIRYGHDEFKEHHKHAMTLEQMPVLEIISNKHQQEPFKLPQSLTIARYLAKEFDLAGKTNLQQAHVDSIVDTMMDLSQQFVIKVLHAQDPEKREISKQEFLIKDLPQQFQNLEILVKMYNDGRGPYFIGEQLTWADLMFYSMAAHLPELTSDETILDKYPKLQQIYQYVKEQPNIIEYVKKIITSEAINIYISILNMISI